MVDSHNRLWVGSSHDGVYCLDVNDGEIIHHIKKENFGNSPIEKIAQLNDSIFVFGYELLHVFNENSGEILTFSYTEGLSSNGIFFIGT